MVFETTAYPEHDHPHGNYRIMPEGMRLLGRQAGLQCMEFVRIGVLFARFAMLWTNYVMGRLAVAPGLGPLALAWVIATNIAPLALDSLIPHPSLATDYEALLVREINP